jgi:LPXTG cell wall anchor motif
VRIAAARTVMRRIVARRRGQGDAAITVTTVERPWTPGQRHGDQSVEPTSTHERPTAMNRRSYVPFIIIAGLLFVTGLVLGAGKSSEDTSAANTASKVLLAVGLLALVVTAVLEIVRRRRTHNRTA